MEDDGNINQIFQAERDLINTLLILIISPVMTLLLEVVFLYGN